MIYYIYPSSPGELSAVDKDGALVTTYQYNDVSSMDEAALWVRDFIKKNVAPYTDEEHKMLFVPIPSAHPVLRALLAKKAAPAEQAEATHLCLGCVHQEVCRGADIAEKLELTISACGHYVEIPDGDEDDE